MATLKIAVTPEDHIQGNENAPITLVEYGDYECPACGYAYPIIKRVQKHFGNKLRFVFRNFPLTEAHPHAEVAAETAEFAGAHKHYWEMHDLLYENQQSFSAPFFIELAASLNLPVAELKEALRDGTYQGKVRHDFMGGVRSGVNGTPTFYINGARYDGAFEFEDMVAMIEELLVKS